MKARILCDVASVYEEPDVESPIVATLEKHDLVELGAAEQRGAAAWVHVLAGMSTGDGANPWVQAHGYLDGNIPIQSLDTVAMADEALVFREPSVVSPVAAQLHPRDRFVAVAVEVPAVRADAPEGGTGEGTDEAKGAGTAVAKGGPKGKKKGNNKGDTKPVVQAWVEAYDERCRRLGFLRADAGFRVVPREVVVATLFGAGSVAAVGRAVAEALREQKWSARPWKADERRREVWAGLTPNPLNRANLLNLTLGLLRFCFLPLLLKVNSKAKIFPSEFLPTLGVRAIVHRSGGGAVVFLTAEPYHFLGSPVRHPTTTRLLESLKTRLKGPLPEPPPEEVTQEVNPPAEDTTPATAAPATAAPATAAPPAAQPAAMKGLRPKNPAPKPAAATPPAAKPPMAGPAAEHVPAAAPPRADAGRAKPAATDGLLSVKCPKCGGRDRVPRAAVGRAAKCNTCGHVFRIVKKERAPG